MESQAIGVLLALVAGSSAWSQVVGSAGDRVASGTGVEPISVNARSYGVGRFHGRLLGGGPAYKAEFDRYGMRFVPALGRAPVSRHLRFTLESVRHGGTVVLEAEPVEPELVGEAITMARGHGVVERYDVRPEGVELSFRFPTRPDGSGDLVVRGKIETDLEAEVGEHLAGLSFTTAELGSVSFGGVIGIDARGFKTPGSLRWDGSHLDLVLPGDFVDDARYPIVLDPLISTGVLIGTAVGSPDVAYDRATGHYLVVFTRRYSLQDVDLLAQRVNFDGTPDGGTLFLASSGVNIDPSVANVNSANSFVVAWQGQAPASTSTDILAIVVKAASGGAISGITTVAATASNERTPDVSGERSNFFLEDDALIVWAAGGSGIMAAQLDIGAGPPTDTPFVHDLTTIDTTPSARLPAISKSGGLRRQHAIVWQEGVSDIVGGLYNAELTALDPELVVTTNGREPDVDGDGGSFMVVFNRDDPSGSPDVFCQATSYDGTAWANRGVAGLVAGTGAAEAGARVSYLGPKYLLAWDIASGSMFGSSSVAIQARSTADCSPCSGWLSYLGPAGYSNANPAIGSRWAGGESNDECLIVWQAVDPLLRTVDTMAARFEAVGGGGAVTNVAGALSCGGGGICSISGPFAFAAAPNIVLSGADPGATIAAIHVGSANSTLVQCPPSLACTILDPFLVIGAFSISGGSASTTFPISCDIALAGSSFRFQYLVANTTATPCLGLPVGVSNTVDAVFGF